MIVVVILLFFLIYPIHLDALLQFPEGYPCQTPLMKRGKCVIINDCPVLFAIFLKKNSTSNDTDQMLRESHCGFVSILFPKVCCSLDNIVPYQHYEHVHNAYLQLQKNEKLCGQQVIPNRFPWMAIFEYERFNEKYEFNCAGVLLSKRYILTAAHCITGPDLPKNVKLTSARLGVSDDKFEIEKSIVHEDYDPEDPNQYNDIALVRLNRTVHVVRGISHEPICFYSEHNKIRHKLKLTGWTKTKSVSDPYIMKIANATVWNNSECNFQYKSNLSAVKLNEKQLCAGGRKKYSPNVPHIDFGEVLMDITDQTYTVIGISSIKPSCCGIEHYPITYTKVSSYLEWINGTMEAE